MERHSTPNPRTLFTIATGIIMLIVLLTVWQKTLHRPDIRGDWEQSCENAMTRRIQITGNEWQDTQTIYTDPSCTQKAFMLKTIGVYELGDKSTEVDGTTHGEFIRQELQLTAFSMESAQVFEQSRCGNTKWETDVTTDVSQTGCIGVASSITECRTEYALVKRDENKLYLGDPAEHSCTRGTWPTKLDDRAFLKTN